MAQITPFVGLDVHASQTHAGVLDQATGELLDRRLTGEPARVVLPFLEQLSPGARAVYEGWANRLLARARGARAGPRRPGVRARSDSDKADRPGKDRPARRPSPRSAARRRRALLRARPCGRLGVGWIVLDPATPRPRGRSSTRTASCARASSRAGALPTTSTSRPSSTPGPSGPMAAPTGPPGPCRPSGSSRGGIAVAGTVPYDERLLDAERAASALLDFDPHAPAVTAIDELARELLPADGDC